MSATSKPKMPGKKEFRAAIIDELIQAQADGRTSIVLVARDIHTKVGGYEAGRKSDHRNGTASKEMETLKRPTDQVLPDSPPSGRGANYAVKYALPRDDIEQLEAERFGGAAVQYETAQQVLRVIAEAAMKGSLLRYGDLAVALGRPEKGQGRAMAQVCNLLDCAAVLAERPLMALWTVRDKDGGINPLAWKTDSIDGLRDLLIEEAATHRYTTEDVDAIRAALNRVRGMGSTAAWKWMRDQMPPQRIMDRLLQREPTSEQDSINDLDVGTDAPIVVPTSGRRFVRDTQVRNEVLKRAEGRCEFCNEPGFLKADGSRYLEAHHIIALSADGKDRRTNVIGLCPDHHRRAHFAADRREMERQMIKIVRKKESRQ